MQGLYVEGLADRVWDDNENWSFNYKESDFGGPDNLDVVSCVFHATSLAVATVNNVSIFEGPSALTLRLVVIKIALEVCIVGIDPFTRNHLSL